MRYRYFDFVVESEIELPGLDEARSGATTLHLTLSKTGSSIRERCTWVDVQVLDPKNGMPPGFAWSFASWGTNLLFRFPRCGEFILDRSRRTLIYNPDPKVEQKAARALIALAVLPRVFGELGHMVIHASSVCEPGIGGLVFVGPSGAGKSTLASSFAREGASFASDDVVLLRLENGKLTGLATSIAASLHRDSLDAILGEDSAKASPAGPRHEDKWRYRFPGSKDGGSRTPVSAILDISVPLEDNVPVSVIRRRAVELLAALIRRMMIIDIDNPHTRVDKFIKACRIANTCPEFFVIGYPRRYEVLPDLRSFILDAVSRSTESDKGMFLTNFGVKI